MKSRLYLQGLYRVTECRKHSVHFHCAHHHRHHHHDLHHDLHHPCPENPILSVSVQTVRALSFIKKPHRKLHSILRCNSTRTSRKGPLRYTPAGLCGAPGYFSFLLSPTELSSLHFKVSFLRGCAAEVFSQVSAMPWVSRTTATFSLGYTEKHTVRLGQGQLTQQRPR